MKALIYKEKQDISVYYKLVQEEYGVALYANYDGDNIKILSIHDDGVLLREKIPDSDSHIIQRDHNHYIKDMSDF